VAPTWARFFTFEPCHRPYRSIESASGASEAGRKAEEGDAERGEQQPAPPESANRGRHIRTFLDQGELADCRLQIAAAARPCALLPVPCSLA